MNINKKSKKCFYEMGFDQWSMLFAGQSLSDDKAPNVNLVQFSKAMMHTKYTAIAMHFIYGITLLFSCPGSSIPDLGQWVTHSLTHSLTATLEFWHKEWLLRVETLQTFDQSDVQTKRQKEKRQKDKKAKRNKYKRLTWEFNIVMSGQFCTLAMFF